MALWDLGLMGYKGVLQELYRGLGLKDYEGVIQEFYRGLGLRGYRRSYIGVLQGLGFKCQFAGSGQVLLQRLRCPLHGFLTTTSYLEGQETM